LLKFCTKIDLFSIFVPKKMSKNHCLQQIFNICSQKTKGTFVDSESWRGKKKLCVRLFLGVHTIHIVKLSIY
jgi:hypothetical protein